MNNDNPTPSEILVSNIKRPMFYVKNIGLLLSGIIVGGLTYQLATRELVIIEQQDIMVGEASPGGTLQLEVKRRMSGACKNFIIKRYLWRWKDKTKTSVESGGEREIAPFVYNADASPFKDDKNFQLDLSLENVPDVPDNNAGNWFYYTTFTPTCPFWVYPPQEWFATPVIYKTQNAPVNMTLSDKAVKLNESKP